MHLDTTILLYAIILIGAIAFVEGVYLLVVDLRGTGKAVNRRLRVIAQEPDQKAAYEILRSKSLGEGAGPWLSSILNSDPVRAFDNLVATSGVSQSTERVLIYMTAATVAAFWGLRVIGGFDFYLCVIGAAALGIGVPLLILRRVRRARLARISSQLPDALDMLVRSLRAGHPIATGMELISREMPDPIGSEFGLVFDGMSYGLDLRGALDKMSQRLNLVEVNYMSAAMRIQHGTGGNLAEVLGALAGVMRERAKLHAKIKALSAEGRFAGKILAALPVLVVSGLLLLSPHYYDAAKSEPGLAIILGVAAGLTVLGALLLRTFVNFRV